MDAPPFLMPLDDLSERTPEKPNRVRSSSTQTTHEQWPVFAAVVLAVCVTCCGALLLRSVFPAEHSAESDSHVSACVDHTTPPPAPVLLMRGTRHHALAHMRLLNDEKVMPHEGHRSFADASSVPLLPPFHPTLVASPALAFAWSSVRRGAERLRVGLSRGAKQVLKSPEVVNMPQGEGEGEHKQQELDLIRQQLRFIDL